MNAGVQPQPAGARPGQWTETTDLRINNNNSLDLAAEKGEVLTLALESGDAVVTFNGLGAQGVLTAATPHVFVVPAIGTDVPLLVRATFKDASGGAATVHVSDAIGNVAPFTFTQFPDTVTNAVVFLIDIH
jgi:hypothetical protein